MRTSLRTAVPSAPAKAATESTTTAVPATKSSTPTKATAVCTATAVAAAEASTASKSTTEASPRAEAASTSVAILTDFEQTALPVVAVELLDGVLRVIRIVEDDDAGALRMAVGSHVNVGAEESTGHDYDGQQVGEVCAVRECLPA